MRGSSTGTTTNCCTPGTHYSSSTKKCQIIYNTKIKDKIDDLKSKQNIIKTELKALSNDLQQYTGKKVGLQAKKQEILDMLTKVKDLESKYEAYKYYMDAIKRDGVPYELIEKALPTIEGEVNDIWSKIVPK